MMVLRLLPIVFALLFILSRRIDVKVYKSNRLTVKINFNILALIIREGNNQKIRFKSLVRFIKNAKPSYRFLNYLISKSEVVLFEHENSRDENEDSSIFKTAYTYLSNQFIISYFERTAQKFRISKYEKRDISIGNSTVFDLNIHFSLWHLIISALILLYYLAKERVGRLLKNV